MPQVNALPIDAQQVTDIKGSVSSSFEGERSSSNAKDSSFSKLVDRHVNNEQSGNSALKRQENSGKSGPSGVESENKQTRECNHPSGKESEESASSSIGDELKASPNETAQNNENSQENIQGEKGTIKETLPEEKSPDLSAEHLVESNKFIAMLNYSEKLLKGGNSSSLDNTDLSTDIGKKYVFPVSEGSSKAIDGIKPVIELITDAEEIDLPNAEPVDKRFFNLDQLHQSDSNLVEKNSKANINSAELVGSKVLQGAMNIASEGVEKMDKEAVNKAGLLMEKASFQSSSRDLTSKYDGKVESEDNLIDNENDEIEIKDQNEKKFTTPFEFKREGKLVDVDLNNNRVKEVGTEKVDSNLPEIKSQNAVTKIDANNGNVPIAAIIAQALNKEKQGDNTQPVIDKPTAKNRNVELTNIAEIPLSNEKRDTTERNSSLVDFGIQPLTRATPSVGRSATNQASLEPSGIDNSSMVEESEKEATIQSTAQKDKLTIELGLEQNARVSPMNAAAHSAAAVLPQYHTLGDSKLGAEYQANIEAITNQASTLKSAEQKQIIALTQETISIYRKDFANAVKDKVMMMVNQKLQQVEIRLDPPELGNVHVRVNLQNEQAAVSFVVQNQQAKEALEQNTDKLREMLAESGVEVGDTNVSQQDQQNAENQNSNASDGLLSQREQEMADDIHHVIENRLFKASANGVDYYA